jgi:hypothetical protein
MCSVCCRHSSRWRERVEPPLEVAAFDVASPLMPMLDGDAADFANVAILANGTCGAVDGACIAIGVRTTVAVCECAQTVVATPMRRHVNSGGDELIDVMTPLFHS